MKIRQYSVMVDDIRPKLRFGFALDLGIDGRFGCWNWVCDGEWFQFAVLMVFRDFKCHVNNAHVRHRRRFFDRD